MISRLLASNMWLLRSKKEASKAKLKAGFYRSPLSPKNAFELLLKRALTSELGTDNIVRVEYAPASDSLGRNALKITAVIDPDAIKRISEGAPLDALVRVQELLSTMRDDRTTIIEYATEAELAQDAGS